MRRARLKITPNLSNLVRPKVPPVAEAPALLPDVLSDDCSPPPLTVRPPPSLPEKENTALIEAPKKTPAAATAVPYASKSRPAPNLHIARKRTLSSSSTGSSSRTRTLSGASSIAEYPPLHDAVPIFDQRKAEHRRRFTNGVPERSKMTVFDFIFHNPSEGSKMNDSEGVLEEVSRQEEEQQVDDVNESLRGSLSDKEDEAPAPEQQQQHVEEDSMPVPQVKIGPDGQIVLDEDSTFIETTATKKAKEDIRKTSLVYDNQATNYGTWAKKRRNVDWSKKETLRFYKALSIFGTDFSMMASIFKKRDRYELKMKFKKEERVNRALVDRCLSQNGQFDLSTIGSESDEEEQEDRRRKAHKRKILHKEAAKNGNKKKRRGSSKSLRRSRGYYSSSPSSEEEEASPPMVPPLPEPNEAIEQDTTFPPGLLAANPGLANATSGSLVVVAASPTPSNANLHVYMVPDKADGSVRTPGGRVRTLSSSSGALEPPPSPKQSEKSNT